MKTFGKIIICIIVVIVAIGIAYLISNQNVYNANSNATNNNQNDTNNELNNTINQTDEDEYIGLEENVEPLEEPKETEEPEEDLNQEDNQQTEPELTGEDKAVDLVKKQYATNGQTVKFDHMEGTNYVIKVNAGTAVTWYLVDGTTWEAEEY